ncbi:hypothetical protein B5S33_g2176 [[Candida] boidinii]|nr:hypothetical protein B5S30_g1245 [[Candida] boidinii]OWB83545.1 hypothetical protein B5S33_g2176 [[Candida] boidinii]
MARNEDSGKGFVFRMLQKVDNLSGVQVGSRLICVDHARYKPPKEAETEEAIGEASKNFSSTVSGYDNDYDHIEDEGENKFEDPMAKLLGAKEKTMNKKRRIDDQKSYKLNRNTGSKLHRCSHRHHHHDYHHKHSRTRNDIQVKASDSYSEK